MEGRGEMRFSAPRGNRLDCAYFLLLGACVAGFLVVTGGVMTHVAYFKTPKAKYDSMAGLYSVQTRYVGPILVAAGILTAVVLVALAIRYGCEHRPRILERMDSGYVNFVAMDETGKKDTV